MSPQQVMQLYQGISHLMGEMVRAANSHDWELLRDLENRCRPLTHTLMAEEPGTALSEESRREKFLLLRKILDDDAAIRSVTQSWMSELQDLIGNTSARRKLNRTYGSGPH